MGIVCSSWSVMSRVLLAIISLNKYSIAVSLHSSGYTTRRSASQPMGDWSLGYITWKQTMKVHHDAWPQSCTVRTLDSVAAANRMVSRAPCLRMYIACICVHCAARKSPDGRACAIGDSSYLRGIMAQRALFSGESFAVTCAYSCIIYGSFRCHGALYPSAVLSMIELRSRCIQDLPSSCRTARFISARRIWACLAMAALSLQNCFPTIPGLPNSPGGLLLEMSSATSGFVYTLQHAGVDQWL